MFASRTYLALLIVSYFSLEAANGQAPPKPVGKGNPLFIMTFNIWNSGDHVTDGGDKIAKHILYKNPDFVTLQEVMNHSVLQTLVRRLGPEWTFAGRNGSYPDTAVLTRHKIVESSINDYASVRAKVQVQFSDGTSTVVNVWSLHLDYHDYGPYAACNRMVTAAHQIDAGEHYEGGEVDGRVQNILQILSLAKFNEDLQRTDEELMLVAGDLNCPSHLDWVQTTKDKHCTWMYQWPVTKSVVDSGLTDAFRLLHPDPSRVPGDTWSTVTKFQDGWGNTIPEPQDRIDMIFFKSNKWAPVNAEVYSGREPIHPKPHHGNNDWPSDHASVIIGFKRV